MELAFDRRSYIIILEMRDEVRERKKRETSPRVSKEECQMTLKTFWENMINSFAREFSKRFTLNRK